MSEQDEGVVSEALGLLTEGALYWQETASRYSREVRTLFAERNAALAERDAATARAEALEAERDDARRWAVRLEQLLAAETASAHRLLEDAYSRQVPARALLGPEAPTTGREGEGPER